MRIIRVRTVGWICVLACSGGMLATAAGEEATAQGRAPTGKWVRSATVGLNATSGNSDTLMVGASAEAEKETLDDLWRFTVGGAYGETEGDKTAENAKAVGRYERNLGERMFVSGTGEIGYDSIADVDYRIILSPALGYYLIRNERMSLSVEAGPSYVFERVGGVDDDYLALRLADRFEYKLSENAQIWQATEYIAEFSDFDNFLLKSEVGAEALLRANLSLSLIVQHTYDNVPAPGLDESDLSILTALSFKF